MPARNGAGENHSQPKDASKYLTWKFQAAGYRVAAFGKVAHAGSLPMQ